MAAAAAASLRLGLTRSGAASALSPLDPHAAHRDSRSLHSKNPGPQLQAEEVQQQQQQQRTPTASAHSTLTHSSHLPPHCTHCAVSALSPCPTLPRPPPQLLRRLLTTASQLQTVLPSL